MKKIYVLLMKTKTSTDRFIRFMTNYEYSHVAISLDKSCDKTYSFGRKKPHSILNGGFITENKNGPFFKVFNDTTCKIYEVETSDEQYEQLKNIIQTMEEKRDTYKYDYLGIAYRFFNIPKTYENKYVCSYFVADVLEKSNIHKFEKEPCFIRAEDFENLDKFKEIYSGKYLLYE